MTTPTFADVYNMVSFLAKPTESEGFEQIIDFWNANPIKYALTVNPIVYTSCIEQFWTTTKAKNINREAQIHAKVYEKKVIISEASIRRDLRFGDERGVDCFSNKVIFKQLILMGKHKSRKTKREDTKLPQTSVPTKHVTDEAVNEEMDDSLERATTTATNLDAKQHSGNISKTQSKATPNEPGSRGTSLGGGSRRQDAMGDTIALTRDEDVFGVNDQDDTSMFDANKDLQGEEVVEKAVVVEEVIAISITTPISTAATTTTTATTPTISMDEITLANALIEMKTSRPKAKGIVMQEPSETPTPTRIVSSQQPSKVQDIGKGTMVEPEMPLMKKAQISLDEELAFKLQLKKMNKKGLLEKKLSRLKRNSKKTKEIAQEGSSKRARDELEQEIARKQRIENENESAELKRCLEIVSNNRDDVTIDATPLSSKSPINVDFRIYKEGRKSFF
nr:hypothetical protein [Tanacetum cinerariifolium]